MSYEPLRSVIHKKVGGGDLHAHIILIYTHLAQKRGYRVDDDTKFLPQAGMELPDAVLSRTDKVHEGARIVRKTWRYRVEVIDTHDPIPDGAGLLKGGYDGVFKLFVREAEKWCRQAHGEHDGLSRAEQLARDWNTGHHLCYESIIRLCERNLP